MLKIKFWLYAAAFLVGWSFITCGISYYKGTQDAKITIVKKANTVMEKRANIANNRPGPKQLIKRMREGSF